MTIDISDGVEKRKNDTNVFAATATMPPNDISISSIHFKNIEDRIDILMEDDKLRIIYERLENYENGIGKISTQFNLDISKEQINEIYNKYIKKPTLIERIKNLFKKKENKSEDE